MSRADGLAVHFSRCNAPGRIGEWNEWMRDTHVPAMAAVSGVRAGTHWALTRQPTPGMPSVGFSHVTLYELTGDVSSVARALASHERALRRSAKIDPNHCVMGVDLAAAHGRWNDKPLPDAALTGHILAWVMCNAPESEAEWDSWNDDVHMPDMLESGAFRSVSRWLRAPRSERGPQHLTLYDVGPEGVEAAVARSAAVMPGIVAAGRKHPCHVGGLTVTLTRA